MLAFNSVERHLGIRGVSLKPKSAHNVDRMNHIKTSLITVVILLTAGVVHAEKPAQETVGYNRDIRPILSDNCFYCHGPDTKHRDGKFRLDDRESALKKKAIVPGDPAASELVKRIYTVDADDVMPPPKTHKKLSDAQKELLKRWITEGAVYQPHWSYAALQRPAVPAIKSPWVANPIDAFVLQKLASHKLEPSVEADKRTLLRRLSLDLIGLPPTQQEVADFLADDSPEAYAHQVDRLLASPHYGERMAVPWLDAVRYADTVGYHGDQNLNAFPYREYVINAFNNNKPFDRFTIEQVAGDLLSNATTEQRVATGFNRLNMVTREGGAQSKEYLAKYAADRVRTVSNAWLGSTMGCCECHDHKYDPFSTRDFYSLGAFFADIKQWGVYAYYGSSPEPELKGINNSSPFPPEITVESPYLQKRMVQTQRVQLDRIATTAGAPLKIDPKQRDAFNAWCRQTLAFLKSNPDGWTTAELAAVPPLKAEANGSVPLLTVSEHSQRLAFTLKPGSIAAIRIEALPHEKLGGKLFRADGANVEFAAVIKPKAGAEQLLPVFFGDADQKKDRDFDNGKPAIGVGANWILATEIAPTATQTGVWILQTPATVRDGDQLIITLGKNPPGCVRISTTPIAPAVPTEPSVAPALLTALEKPTAAMTSADNGLIQREYLLSTGWSKPTLDAARKVQQEMFEARGGKAATVVTIAREPRVTRILPRGNWRDDSGDIVLPAVPHFLPQPSNPDGRRLTRLDLGQWLVSAENPLTPRVFVNRLWKQFFGAGLSNSPEDFGAQGEFPTHPELLDYLATEFRDRGWDVKRMVRLIVMSNTYRQDSHLRRELADVDPANRLLSSQSPRRLEAEFVRDNALAVSGLINLDIGGPSVFPYQPEGYYSALQFPNRSYINSTDDRQYRRGLYTHWQRTFLHPVMANFDAPSREDSVCTRSVSNTPQQALTLLNSPTFVEAARALAVRAVAAGNGEAQRLEYIYQAVLIRSPKPAEAASLTAFLAGQRTQFKASPADAKALLKVGNSPIPGGADELELAAWTAVCRVILNLHESITRY